MQKSVNLFSLFLGSLCLVAFSCQSPQHGDQPDLNPALERLEDLADSLDRAYKLKKIDASQTLLAFDSLEQTTRKNPDEPSPEIGLLNHFRGRVHYSLQDYETAEECFLEAVFHRENSLPIHHPDIAKSYNNLAIIYYDKYQDYFRALPFALKAARFPDQMDNMLKQQVYRSLFRIYSNIGDYDEAIHYQENSISAAEQDLLTKSGKDSLVALKKKASLCNDMAGILAARLEDPCRAMPYALEAYSIYENHTSNRTDSVTLANILNNLGLIRELSNELQPALNHYQSSLSINQAIGERDGYIAGNYDNLSIVYKKMGLYTRSLEYAKKALKYHQKTGDPTRLSYVYDNMAEVYLLQNRPGIAIGYLNLAMKMIVPGFHPDEPLKNPVLSTDASTDRPSLYLYLHTKALALEKQYKNKGKIDHLIAAYQTYLKADSLADALRLDYRSDASKESLIETTKPVYERSIGVCHQLNLLTGEEKYAIQAFDLMEKSKSIVLLEAVRRADAENLIDSTLFAQEKQLNLRKSYYEKEFALRKLEDPDDPGIPQLLDSLSKYRTLHASIIHRVVAEHPEYNRVKNNTKTVTIQAVQNTLLQQDQCVFSYFTSEKTIYGFRIDPSDYRFIALPEDDSLMELVRQMHRAIQDQATLSYAQQAYSLYQKIFQPLAGNSPVPDQLVIIPDGFLNYLSFDALLTRSPETFEPMHVKDYPYLIKDHRISYQYSATLWQEMAGKSGKPSQGTSLAAFAPSFKTTVSLPSGSPSENTIQLAPLGLNASEVRQISSFMDGRTYLNRKANLDAFLSIAPESRVLHLATHALANGTNGDLSFIVFSGNKRGRYELLHARDLYTLRLNASLVTLSACESHAGELQSGEGLISLARGFAYAGAKSLLSTLWVTHEKATVDIMTSFYKNLAEGSDKSSALCKAKTTYIGQQKIQRKAHPFYWAGFVLMGSDAPLSQ